VHPDGRQSVQGGVQIGFPTHTPAESNVDPDAQEIQFVAEVQIKQSAGQTVQTPLKYYPATQHVAVHG
jgi:hypothetical protein